jgi:hypothetical protein
MEDVMGDDVFTDDWLDPDADVVDSGVFENMGKFWFIKNCMTEGPFDTEAHAQKTLDMWVYGTL